VNKILVVGSDGFLGSHFTAFLNSQDIPYRATSRSNTNSEQRLKLELSEWEKFDTPADVAFAVIFAGISGFKKCHQNLESKTINTDFIPELSSKLISQGIKVIYISSSAVFPSVSTCAETDIPDPDSDYGRNKLLAETKISAFAEKNQSLGKLAIIRPTKILCTCSELLKKWKKAIEQGRKIDVPTDLLLSPISTKYVFEVVMAVINSDKSGIFHLSGKDSIPLSTLALHFLTRPNLNLELVNLIKSEELEEAIFYKHTTGKLHMPRTTEILKFAPQTTESLFLDLIESINLPHSDFRK
jgi:dTDP-4-dehydrorhamnose reductase